MFVAGGIWCLTDVSSVSPSSKTAKQALKVSKQLKCPLKLTGQKLLFKLLMP